MLRGWCDERAMDGVAPELSPGWAHRRINTYPEVRHAPYELKTKALSMLCACRTALVLFFPQRDILSRFGRCAIHGYACHRPSTARFDLLCCSLDLRMSLLFCAGIVCVCTVWERGRFARNTLCDKHTCMSWPCQRPADFACC